MSQKPLPLCSRMFLCSPVFLCLLMLCLLAPHTLAGDMYLNPSAGYIIMNDSTASGNVMTVKSTGNVGIGTTGPNDKLEVYAGNLRLRSTSDGNEGVIRLFDSTNTESGQIYPNAGDLKIYSAADVLFTMAGNVGIGTTGPNVKLEVEGNIRIHNIAVANGNLTNTVVGYFSGQTSNVAEGASYGGMKIISDATSWYKGRLGFFTNDVDGTNAAYPATEKVTILSNGNVGIGTTGPGAKLEVAGNIKANASNPLISIQNAAGTPVQYNLGVADSDSWFRLSKNGGSNYMAIDAGNNWVIFPTGSVGVGKQSPGATLDVKGAGTGTGFTFRTQDSAGTDRFVIQDNGNVGIGTTGPSQKLDIYTGHARILGPDGYNASGEKAILYLGDYGGDANTGAAGIAAVYAQGLKFGVYKVGSSGTLGSASVDAMVIAQSSGNVGIGTTNPLVKLVVSNSGAEGFEFYPAGGGTGIDLLSTYKRSTSAYDSFRIDSADYRFTIGGAEKVRIDTSGNVGIGTTGPGSALDVKGTLRLSGSTSGYVGLAPTAAAGSTTYTLPSADGTNGYVLSTNGSGALSWIANGSGSSQWTTSGSNIYYNNGNVGIGTTAPGALLDIAGATAATIGARIQGTGGRWYFQDSNSGTTLNDGFFIEGTNAGGSPNNAQLWLFENGFLRFATNNQERVRITSDGNVGIGTTDPGTYKLHVEGGMIAQAYTTGDIMFRANDNGPDIWRMFEDEHSLFTESLATGQTVLTIKDSGNVGIGTTGPSCSLDVNSNKIRVRTAKTPASAADTGDAGDICWDSSYIYICVDTNTWKRALISTW